MRKAAVLTGFIALLSVFLIAGIFLTVKNKSNDIEITEEVIAGDPAYAEGLSVEFGAADNMASDNRWTVSYALRQGGAPAVKAEFHKKILPSDSKETAAPDVCLTACPADAVCFTMAEAVSDYPFLAEALEETASETEPGKTCRKEFFLRDYTANLPVEFFSEDSIKRTQLNTDSSGKRKDFSHFALPTPEDCKVSVEIKKNKSDEVISVSLSLSSVGLSCFDSRGIFCENGICVSVTSPEKTESNGSDAIPAIPNTLCGIHFIPYEEQNKSGKRLYYRPDMDDAQLIYPMKKDDEVLKLMEDPENRELILILREKDTTVVSFIDAETMKVKQRLSMDKNISQSRLSCCRLFNGSLLLFTDQGNFTLIYKMDNAYRTLSGSFSRGGLTPAGLLLYSDTLVITAAADEAAPINHYLLICDETGTLYEGFYRFSLQSDTITQESSSVIQDLWEENPMSIRRRDPS